MRTLAERIDLFKNSDLYPVVSSEFCNGRGVCSIVEAIALPEQKSCRSAKKISPMLPCLNW